MRRLPIPGWDAARHEATGQQVEGAAASLAAHHTTRPRMTKSPRGGARRSGYSRNELPGAELPGEQGPHVTHGRRLDFPGRDRLEQKLLSNPPL